MPVAAVFRTDDETVFKLRDEVEASEGAGITFYDFLGVLPAASHDDVVKALKKKSKSLHPDRARHSFVASRSTPSPKKSGEKQRKTKTHVSRGPTDREVQRFVKQAGERYSRLG